jgi:methionyl aminopeptidase
MVTLRTADEIALLREAGRVVALTLAAVSDAARPGVRLTDLDAVAAEMLVEHGAKSSFLHYQPRSAPTPYPAVLCLSVNDTIVHGIPDGRRLRDGDVVSIDFGAELDGYHGDSAITLIVGTPASSDDQRLVAATKDALDAAIAAAVLGNRLGDVAHAVEQIGRKAGYGILADHGGHGVGTAMHEDPSVPNTGSPGRGLRLREGMVFAIEPMFTLGGRDSYRIRPDGWSIETDDGSRAAHWEHTIAITAAGPRILTTL